MQGEELPPYLGKVERGPHLTQSRLGWGLAPYQVASWFMQPFGRNRHGPKIGWGLCPFGGGELRPHLIQCGQGRGLPACQVSSWSVQPFDHSAQTSQTDRTGQTDRERIDSIARTVLQTVAQKTSRCWLCAMYRRELTVFVYSQSEKNLWYLNISYSVATFVFMKVDTWPCGNS